MEEASEWACWEIHFFLGSAGKSQEFANDVVSVTSTRSDGLLRLYLSQQ